LQNVDYDYLQDIAMAINTNGYEINTFEKGKVPRIAVQIHMFYLETLKETVTNLNQIPYTFDCFVSTDTEEKRQKILEIMTQHCRCRKTVVEVMQNRGRDVAPFLIQLAPILDQYDYIGHVHSKKTLQKHIQYSSFRRNGAETETV